MGQHLASWSLCCKFAHLPFESDINPQYSLWTPGATPQSRVHRLTSFPGRSGDLDEIPFVGGAQ